MHITYILQNLPYGMCHNGKIHGFDIWNACYKSGDMHYYDVTSKRRGTTVMTVLSEQELTFSERWSPCWAYTIYCLHWMRNQRSSSREIHCPIQSLGVAGFFSDLTGCTCEANRTHMGLCYWPVQHLSLIKTVDITSNNLFHAKYVM